MRDHENHARNHISHGLRDHEIIINTIQRME